MKADFQMKPNCGGGEGRLGPISGRQSFKAVLLNSNVSNRLELIVRKMKKKTSKATGDCCRTTYQVVG
jgi:hypothetical protein